MSIYVDYKGLAVIDPEPPATPAQANDSNFRLIADALEVASYGVISASVNSDTVIAVGDLLYLDTDDAKPASAVTDNGSLAANQLWFAANFLGVALEAHPAGEAAMIRVATAGLFTFESEERTYNVGDWLGACENGDGDALLNGTLAIVDDPLKRIATVAQQYNSAVVEIECVIHSTVVFGLFAPVIE